MHCCRGKPSCYFLSPDLELLAHALSQQELARVPSAGQCNVHSTACPGGEDNLVVTRSAKSYLALPLHWQDFFPEA